MATVIQPSARRANGQRAELLRLRSKYLNGDRILGPAWILLIRLLSKSGSADAFEVCDFISIPDVAATSAQRCLDYLLAQGLIHLGPGPGRRFRSVDLTPQALQEMRSLLAEIEDPHESERTAIASLIGAMG